MDLDGIAKAYQLVYEKKADKDSTVTVRLKVEPMSIWVLKIKQLKKQWARKSNMTAHLKLNMKNMV